MVTKAFDYALRSMVYMASLPDQEYFGVKELADAIQVSRTYLGKILQSMVQPGFLKSITGPGGGFGLAMDPRKITLYEILMVIDGPRLIENCVLGLNECSDENPCPVHTTWQDCRNKMVARFMKTSVKDATKSSWPQFRPPKTKKRAR